MTIYASCGHTVEDIDELQPLYFIEDVWGYGQGEDGQAAFGIKSGDYCPECYAYYVAINDPYVAFSETGAMKLLECVEKYGGMYGIPIQRLNTTWLH